MPRRSRSRSRTSGCALTTQRSTTTCPWSTEPRDCNDPHPARGRHSGPRCDPRPRERAGRLPRRGRGRPRAWLHHQHELRSWVAVEDKETIGQIMLTGATFDNDAACLWHEQTGGSIEQLAIPARLFVDPNHRGTGAGRLLMEAAVTFARLQKLAVAFGVMLKDHSAIRLYERLGAHRVGNLTHHYNSGLTEPAAVYTIGADAFQTASNLS
ncbi:GNAT family N-acetyltransferase [Promicromonospora sp. NPDC060204]|uniref:GNAT family N-acetyltransferase n=1 Tax=Promicromonospora sp. NPDC060204 TaxID=3347071 RepID=UPI00365DAA4C